MVRWKRRAETRRTGMKGNGKLAKTKEGYIQAELNVGTLQTHSCQKRIMSYSNSKGEKKSSRCDGMK